MDECVRNNLSEKMGNMRVCNYQLVQARHKLVLELRRRFISAEISEKQHIIQKVIKMQVRKFVSTLNIRMLVFLEKIQSRNQNT